MHISIYVKSHAEAHHPSADDQLTKSQNSLCFLFASWWRHSSYFLDHLRGDFMTSILLKDWMSCAGVLTLPFFIAKLTFTRIWIIFFPLSKPSAVLSHAIMSSVYCRFSGASPAVHFQWEREDVYNYTAHCAAGTQKTLTASPRIRDHVWNTGDFWE